VSVRFQLVIDCADPDRLTRFWSTALGYQPLATRKERVVAEAERLIAAGATRVRVSSEEGLDHYGEVMHDPEGNEFCIH